jgi:hypothetical protein
MASTRTGARKRLARRLGWLGVLSLVSTALLAPSASPALAAGPGDNGSGWPDGGPKSDATVDGSASATANTASMNTAKMFCDGSSAGHFTGSFDLTEDMDAGSTIVLYLAANNGSNASPAGNVSKNYAVVDVEDAGTYPFTLDVTAPFTATQGGVLIVFAVNEDGTVISSSKSNSLNCTESESTPTPTETPDDTPKPTDTPEETPTPTDTPEETPTPTDTPEETPTPTETPDDEGDQASILIAKVDNRGTEDPDDDVLLDGASFEVYADDGDETFDADDELVFGPAVATGGMLDTDLLDEGDYWIVESTVPDGFEGSDPILVELNVDPSKTCIWDSAGLIECEVNQDEEDLSLTIVIVDNTPEESVQPTDRPNPTGDVGGAVGTPRPRATLPATDTLDGVTTSSGGDSWRIVLLGMAGLLTAMLMLTPTRTVARKEDSAR